MLTKEAMLAELCRALLRGGHFSLAQSYLQVTLHTRFCHVMAATVALRTDVFVEGVNLIFVIA